MPATASSPQRRDLPNTSARGVPAAIAVLFALVIATAITVATDKNDSEAVAAVDAGAVVLPLAQATMRVTVAAARQQPPAARIAQHKRPPFTVAYRAMLKLVALANLPRIEEDATLAQSAIIGTASSYNPYRHSDGSGGFQTASGEFYDPAAWTAAIQIDLRARAGGVRYGRFYQPTFVLVESGGKRAIVKINDVGPLKPGRVIDLNERAMRYFDPYLRRGLLPDVKLTLLPGADWTPGPIANAPLAIFASAD
jgi:peptidoglycan lytic transglycosylase